MYVCICVCVCVVSKHAQALALDGGAVSREVPQELHDARDGVSHVELHDV